MLAYIGLLRDGTYELCVSAYRLNPVGTRLERGPNRRLPENVRLQAQTPGDPQLAIAGLRSLERFLNDAEYGSAEVPEFGEALPTRRRKK